VCCNLVEGIVERVQLRASLPLRVHLSRSVPTRVLKVKRLGESWVKHDLDTLLTRTTFRDVFFTFARSAGNFTACLAKTVEQLLFLTLNDAGIVAIWATF
jgi:hypothetical protein